MFRINFLWLSYLKWAVICFLSGGILFSYEIPLILKHTDIRLNSEDQNPGSAHVFTQLGWKWGLLCVLCDIGKAWLPVHLSAQILDISSLYFAMIIAAPVLGHAIAPYNSVSGGKGIAPAFGTLLGLLPYREIVYLLAVIYVFFAAILVIKPNRICSIVTFSIFAIVSLIMEIGTNCLSVGIGCLIISTVVILKHASDHTPQKSFSIRFLPTLFEHKAPTRQQNSN